MRFVLLDWSFNIKTFTSSSLKAGNSNIDNFLIAYFINVQMVGIYQIIKKILSPIGSFVSPFSMLVYPKLVNYFETKQKEKFKEIIFRISFYIGLFCLAYCLIFFFAFEYIFEIMKVEFFENYNIVYLLFALFIKIFFGNSKYTSSNSIPTLFEFSINGFIKFMLSSNDELNTSDIKSRHSFNVLFPSKKEIDLINQTTEKKH